MALIDLSWACYQRVFAPQTIPLSYVDNFETLASSCASLLVGFGTLEEFMTMWHLELDDKKTFFWSTQTTDRNALRRLGKQVCLQIADLGGSLTFCRRRGAGTQLARISSLDLLWIRLRKASMPSHVKEYVLRQALWAKAFYAVGVAPLHWKIIQQLRAKAVRALGHGLAGANPGLRLSLLTSCMSSDPGYFQLQQVFQDFRRLLRKIPDLLEMWALFVRNFDGDRFAGPFCKLLEQCELIGWVVREPPRICDHDGFVHDLLTMPSQLLTLRLQDAWHQRLACELQRRADFASLQGLHWPASRHESRLSALQVARINSLREGVFLCKANQGKYDLVKGTACSWCAEVDSMERRALRCPAFAQVRALHGRAVDLWPGLPRVLVEHLLSPRLPGIALRLRSLHTLPDVSWRFHCAAFPEPCHHLFTDGSCDDPTEPRLALASRAVVSASHECALCAGPSVGIVQNINRAELMAALVALRWTYEECTSSVLWVDSAYVGEGLAVLLETRVSQTHETNEDLWMEVESYVLAMDPGALRVQHVNSHRAELLEDDPVDAWSAKWNRIADREAGRAQAFRPMPVQRALACFRSEFLLREEQMDLLRAFHLDLAEAAQDLSLQPDPELDLAEEDVPEDDLPPALPLDGGDWIDQLPLSWMTIWQQHPWATCCDPKVVFNMVTWLQTERERAQFCQPVSWLELAAMLVVTSFRHPYLASKGSQNFWRPVEDQPVSLCTPLTVALRIRFVRDLIRNLISCFGLNVDIVHGIDLSCLLVHPPQSGVVLMISIDACRRARHLVSNFTATRPYRTVNDLARLF